MSHLSGFWHYSDRSDAAHFCNLILAATRSQPSMVAGSSPYVSNNIAGHDLFDGVFIALGIGHGDFPGHSEFIDNRGMQPLASADNRYRLVADIRIDNRDELISALNLDNPCDAGRPPDTAILMAAWQRWQQQCLPRIVGTYAIAVWDAQERTLCLARDPAGEKSLYYHAGSKYFAFATTARALLQCPGIDAGVDETHLALTLCGMSHEHSRSYLKAVNSVRPGHCVMARPGSISESAFWRLEDVPDIRFARDDDYVQAFLEVFDEAVRCRLPSTGRVATELSAGLDSSSVCATAARLLAAQGRGLIAFTSVPAVDVTGRFPDRYLPDEGPAAAELARLYPNIEHHLVTSSGSNLIKELQRTHPALDCPMANPLNHVWVNLIQQQASLDGATVLLNGQRGNITISTPGLLRDFFRRGSVFSAVRLAIQHNRSWAPLVSGAFRMTWNSLLPRRSRSAAVKFDPSPLNPQLAAELHMHDRFREYTLRPSETFRAAKWRDFNYFDVGDFNSAAQSTFGIDRRDPTSDQRVLAFCLGIPMEQYVAGGINCSLIRRSMRGRLPEQTLYQSRKGLQAGDWYESITAILPLLIAELGSIERSSLAQRMLDLPCLRQTLENWPKSATAAALDEPRYHAALTRGLACGYFLREYEGIR